MQIRAVAGAGIPAEVQNEVARAMETGSALLQASLEHLETAERSWDKWVAESGTVIQRYPTEVQVLSYMSQMSRSRQRECLAQRGKRRAGGQKGSVRNYVAEMGNNLCRSVIYSSMSLDSRYPPPLYMCVRSSPAMHRHQLMTLNRDMLRGSTQKSLSWLGAV